MQYHGRSMREILRAVIQEIHPSLPGVSLQMPSQNHFFLSALNNRYPFRFADYMHGCRPATFLNAFSLGHGNFQTDSNIIGEVIAPYRKYKRMARPSVFIENNVCCAAANIDNGSSQFTFIIGKYASADASGPKTISATSTLPFRSTSEDSAWKLLPL